MGLPSKQVFTILCRTGCTCCSGENHYRGPYKTRGDAERRVAHFLNDKNSFCPVASRYARRGRYTAYESKMEILDDGRAILASEVLDKTPAFVEVRPDGTVADNRAERMELDVY